MVADPDRARRDSVLCCDRLFREAALTRTGQGEIQSRRGEPAVPGRDDRRREYGEERSGRADHARAVGGETRSLCQDELRRCDAGLGRAARHSVHQQADDSGAASVRRQGGDRRRSDRRRTRRLQHDRLAGGAANSAPVADLAGFSAGADLDRASRRYPEHAARILVGGAPPAADAARRDRISPRRLPLSSGRARGLERHFARHPAGRDDWHCRAIGLRQIDPDQARPAPLSAERGTGADSTART